MSSAGAQATAVTWSTGAEAATWPPEALACRDTHSGMTSYSHILGSYFIKNYYKYYHVFLEPLKFIKKYCKYSQIFYEATKIHQVVSRDFLFLFYTGHKKYRFFPKQLPEHIGCQDVFAEIN